MSEEHLERVIIEKQGLLGQIRTNEAVLLYVLEKLNEPVEITAAEIMERLGKSAKITQDGNNMRLEVPDGT